MQFLESEKKGFFVFGFFFSKSTLGSKLQL